MCGAEGIRSMRERGGRLGEGWGLLGSSLGLRLVFVSSPVRKGGGEGRGGVRTSYPAISRGWDICEVRFSFNVVFERQSTSPIFPVLSPHLQLLFGSWVIEFQRGRRCEGKLAGVVGHFGVLEGEFVGAYI